MKLATNLRGTLPVWQRPKGYDMTERHTAVWMQLIATALPLEGTLVGDENRRQDTKLRLDNKQVPALASKGIGGDLCPELIRI